MSLDPQKLAGYLRAVGQAYKVKTTKDLFPTENLKVNGASINEDSLATRANFMNLIKALTKEKQSTVP